MTDLFSRLDQLSPAKRALLEKLAARGGGPPAADAPRGAGEAAPGPAPPGLGPEAPAAPRPMPRGDAAPLSFAQERLWFMDRLQPGEAAYHVAYRVGVDGPLDAAALRRALSGVAARHEALRTVFEERGDGAVQVVAPPAPVALPLVDLSRLRPAARERTSRALAREEAVLPFDLRRGPLLRAALLRLDGGEHALLLTLHHVVTDGWSMGVLFRELSALYAAATGGDEADLPPLPLQYADFAVWQRQRLRPGGGTLERELDFWRGRLAGAPALLELPADHPRGAARGRPGGQVELAVPAETAAALRRLGRAEGTTPFITLLAAFQLLLSRYAGQDEVVVGTPIAGRTHRELEALAGFFVNALAVRVDVSGDPTFRALLRRTREAVLGAFAHQEVPFERLVEELQPERSPGRSPVFQAMFTLHGGDGPGLRLPGARTEVEEVWSGRAKFDVSVALRDGGGALSGTFAYDAALFERATAERMAAHFVALLGAAAAAPGDRVSALSLVDEAERRRLEAWNDTDRGDPGLLAHEMFARQAARTPDAPAVACGAERMSYAQLDAASGRIARALREMGVRAESRVAVFLERSVEMVAAVLGVLRAGGAYVPLDPEYPAERLRLVLEDANPHLLLSRAPLAAKLPGRGLAALFLDRDAARIAAMDAGPVEGGAGPDGLAYVIYTSGSTGTPKGVLVEHRGLAGLLRAAREEFGFREGDVAAALASFAFDIWGFETLAPLAAGGAVRLVPRERVMDARALLEECRDATLLHAVPALMRQVVEAGRGALPAARRLFVGGDVVPPELLEAMRATFPRAETRVLYGPTEGTVLASSHPLAGGPVPARPVIGRPLGNVRLYVAGGAGELLPAGIPGELLIGGAGVARGYLGRPGLTAEKFVPDAFSGAAGARLYRTGDRVRRLADGTLEFLGRVDFQVKIRGFRIEPGEVEAALLRHPEVHDSAVVAREDRPGERRLVAYVVPEPGAAPARDALRAWLRDRLPEHMVPGALVVVDALPLTPEGKVDRRALPAPASSPDDPAEGAPRTPEEEIVAGIWADVLGTERVGIHDDFFQLGGHSLLATRVVSRVRALLGAELPLRALFESPTVAGIAAELRSHGGVAALPLVPAPRGRPLPLSFSQQRLWFLDRMEPVNAHHNIPFALRLEGPLDPGALERALAEVVRRHEALRTVFREDDGGPVQVVLPADGFRLPVVELGGLPQAERERAMRVRAEAELGRPVDLEAGPLMRAALLGMGRDEHVLLLMVHHAAGDAWSFGVLYRELSRLYAAFLAGEPSPLAPLPVQYGDYAAWQREHLRGDTLERQVAFWRERLEGAPPLLELPMDRPRPALQTHRAGEVAFTLPAALRSRLRELDRREGVTPFMTVLAALAVLLRRLSGQDDVVVGTPIAGRTRAETEGLIGFFVNMLALRTDLSGDPSFRELLGRVREATLGAYAHQDVPFEKLLEELRVQRSLGHASVYQVSMVLHNADVGLPELEGVRASIVALKNRSTPFDLTLVVAETADGGMRGSLIYNADLFDEATAAAHAALLRAVLEDAAARPDAPISTIAPVLEEERAMQLERWSATARGLPSHRPVHQLLREAARRAPDAPAVVQAGAETLSHAELHRRADALARRLAGLGVAPETRVALCLERSPEMLVAVLAVLKAGGCYVPVDPAYPPERIRYVLADSGARVLLTQQRLLGTLPEFAGEVVACDTPLPPAPSPARGEGEHDNVEPEGQEALPQNWGRVASLSEPGGGPPADASSVSVDPDNAAYVIYTSGSTGRPKGVVVSHGALASYASAAVGLYGVGPGDRVLQFASLSFDASAEEIYPALLGGACLVLRTDEMLADAATFLARCDAWGVSVLDLPTAYWHELTAELERGALRLPGAVRLVIIGGERALPERVAAWRRQVGDGVRLVNTYGPTEATVVATLAELQGRDEPPLRPDQPPPPVPIGRPVPGGRVYVLDPDMRPLPLGARGELYVGGAGVARGYLGRPELTAERFVPDPFAAEGGARLYRTGDVARWRRTGELEFAGRADEQVKVRGFRVEPGEIEDVLLRHPAVREAVVAAREDEPGRTRLVGYVVTIGQAPSVAELRAHLKGELPEHMVPAAFVVLDALPRTGSGKIDRRALPAPEAAGAPADAYVAPRTETERRLAEIWAAVLRVERVGASDDFFELGGHSLLATQVVSRVRRVFGAELPLRAVFEHPTLAALAMAVGEARQASAPPVVPRDRSVPAPLSLPQQRLWFLDRMEPVNAHFNIAVALRLSGPLDAAVLERCFTEIVRRHESLRTVFRDTGDGAVQVVAPPADFPLPVCDLSRLPADRRDAEALRVAGGEAGRPVDLEAGPLVRIRLLRLAPREHVLLLLVHHAVADAWSFGVMYRELAALYPAFARGAPSPLPEPALQYADFSAWQRERLAGDTLERQLAFWRERLRDAPALLELPTDRPRPAVQTHRAGMHTLAVPPAAAGALREAARRAGATLFMVLLAGYAATLRRYAGQDDVVVGTPIAGRTRAETEGMIGFFVNMLPMRTDLSGDPTFAELLGRVREATLGAYAHQDVPFEKLLEELDVPRSLGHAAVYQVSINLPDAGGSTLELPGIRVSPASTGVRATALDLVLTAGPTRDGGLYLAATYNADLFDAATAGAMAAYMARVLAEGAADPSRRLSALSPLLDDERAMQLERWSSTARGLPSHRPVHQLLREAALRTPDAPAVVQAGAETLSHAELHRRADALARRLAGLGVAPETRVALCLERSPEMLVAVLAVLKAGGCYVPVDPAYPPERIRYVLADSGARVLLTQQRLLGTLPEFAGEVVVCDTPLPPAPSPARGEGEHDNVEPEGQEALPQNWGRVASLSEPGGGAPADASGISVDPDNAAYVIYTSGSTGRPKGVVVSHGALASYASAAVGLYGVGPGDRVLQFASLSFDASAEEIYPALMGSACLVLRTDEMLADAATFLARCDAWGVSVLDLPTAYWHELTAELERGALRLPGAVRLVIIGGERALSERVAAWRRQVGDGVRLVNTYGPTEATVVATLAELQGRDEPPLRPDQPPPPVPIGRPVPGGRVYVLDPDMRPLPLGARGELYVGGAGVARGYLGRPDLTAERFVPDPFAVEGGARLYRTGDVARWRRTGELEFVGRADEQVKVRGFRVEPGEIEDVLLRHPAVREAVVAAREDEPGRTRLVGYVVTIGQAPSVAELRAHLKGELPEHMVPAAFVVLDALPRTGSGKIDRRALPAPEAAGAPADAYVAPRTETERRLAEIWAAVLRVERVGASDDFFELGGHSLLAMRLASRVRQAFGIELPLRAVFERPTVGGLAALLPAETVPAADAIGAAAPALEDQLLEGLDALSDADVERLLAELSSDGSPTS